MPKSEVWSAGATKHFLYLDSESKNPGACLKPVDSTSIHRKLRSDVESWSTRRYPRFNEPLHVIIMNHAPTLVASSTSGTSKPMARYPVHVSASFLQPPTTGCWAALRWALSVAVNRFRACVDLDIHGMWEMRGSIESIHGKDQLSTWCCCSSCTGNLGSLGFAKKMAEMRFRSVLGKWSLGLSFGIPAREFCGNRFSVHQLGTWWKFL